MSIIIDSYPLSPLQEGMLFNALYAPHSGVDITQILCRMHHSLDVRAFERAWNTVIARHAILRTAFRWNGIEGPLQNVYDDVNPEFIVQDLKGLPPAEQNARVEAHLSADRRRGFDISKPPLIRFAVFLVSPDEHIFLWSLHHLTLDAHAFALVLKEVFAAYDATVGGTGVTFETRPPYRAYIEWIRKQDMTEAEKFWRDLLKGFTTPLSLSVAHDTAMLSNVENRYGREEIVLAPGIREALKPIAKEHGFTLYTCFQAAWSIILGRYSGQRDVVFASVRGCRGVPIDNAASIIGMFINTLPVRVLMDEKQSLVSFLKNLRAQHVASRAYEHSALTKIQQWSDVPPGMSLFESIMSYESRPWSSILTSLGADFTKREWEIRNQTNVPIGLDIYEEPETSIVVDYDTSLFDAPAMKAMLGHYGTLLEGFAANPHAVLGDLPMLTDAERKTILVEWNKSEADYPRGRTIHSLFEEHAARAPGATAVALGDRSLTYGELNERANKIAHHLRKHGVGAGTPVAVCADRTIEMVIALVGTLKAGGAYVPMDPLYPRERLAFMLEDTNAPVLLTEEKIVVGLPGHDAYTIRLDADWETVAGERSDNPDGGAGADDLAYIIYTSGSTGKPKGVCCRHRNLLNLLADFARRSALSPGDRCGLWTSVSFDASVMEIFSPLTAGGALYIASDAIRFDSGIYFNWLSENCVSAAFVPPLMIGDLYAWVVKNPGRLALKRLATGVEPINEKLLVGIMERVPGLAIMNGYGPTETTVCATQYDVRPGTARDRNTPIGRPVQNAKIYILDQYMRPVPIGVRGEIYIGGEGLAVGYLNRPELTAERFVDDPFSGVPGERLYRTGDTARYAGDGNIEFIGRVDFQVKVRGFRVEPGEIETVLDQHQSVKDTVVLARDDHSGTKRLVAYVVPAEGKSPTAADMREFLVAKLPDYMVPSVFVVMESFPLTSNGKLDRSRLPEPDLLRDAPERKFVAPRNEIEIQLKGIWERVLGVKPVSVTDNFFEIGGHSLLAVRLFSEINRLFGRNIELAELFQSPTIEKLARIIRAGQKHDSGSSLVAIQPEGSKPPIFFVHAYGGGVFFYRELAENLDLDRPFYGLQSIGLDGTKRPHTSVEEMAAHYIREIRTVQPEGPYYIGGRCLGAYVAFEMANQLRARGEQVGMLVILDSYWDPITQDAVPQRMLGHARKMLRGSFRERLSYFWKHAIHRTRVTKMSLAKVLSDVCYLFRHPVPSFMKDYYVTVLIPALNTRAEKKYRPSIYPGKITFFQATAEVERDPSKFWGKLTSGGIEVIMVPASHMDILVEPNVSVLAEKLRMALDESRGGT